MAEIGLPAAPRRERRVIVAPLGQNGYSVTGRRASLRMSGGHIGRHGREGMGRDTGRNSGRNSGSATGTIADGVHGVSRDGAADGHRSGSGRDTALRGGRLDASVEAAIVEAYEAWDGNSPRLDDFIAEFGISRPTLYAVLRRNGRRTKRQLLLLARARIRDLDPPDGDGAGSDGERADDEARRWEAEARRLEAEVRRLRAMLRKHDIDPDATAGGS